MRGGLAAGVVALAVVVAYGGTAAHWHGPDAAFYADLVLDGQLLHHKHLLHSAFAAPLVVLAEVAGFEGPVIEPLVAFNTGVAALGAALLVLLVARRAGALAGLVGGLALACCYGWWSLSVDYEVHVLPAVVVLVALGVATGGEVSWLRGAMVGAFQGLATLVHQVAALSGPGLSLALLAGAGSWRARIGACVAQAVLFFAVLLGGYGPAAQMESRAVGEPVGIADLLMSDGDTPPPAPDRTLAEAVAMGWGGNVVVTSTRRCLGGPDVGAVPRVALAGAGALVGLLVLLRGREVDRLARPELLAAGGWVAVYVPVIAWREPMNHEYYTVPTMGLVVVAALGAGPGLGRLLGLALLGGAGLAATHNLSLDLLPASTTPGGEHRLCMDGEPDRGRSLSPDGVIVHWPDEALDEVEEDRTPPPSKGRHGGPGRGVRGKLPGG